MVYWILIALMVVMPLRAAMALDRVNCEMHDADTASAHDHSMHMMHDMNDQVQPLATDQQTCCCCDGTASCTSDCTACGIATCGSMDSISSVTVFHRFWNH